MTKHGHTFTGILFAAPLALSGNILMAAALVAGSNLPDQLEFSRYNRNTGHVSRLIPHRTLTHYLWLWIAALWVTQIYSDFQIYINQVYLFDCKSLLIGLILGAIGHICIDMCSPTGVPLLTPFGKRTSIEIYKTGRNEYRIQLPILIISFSGSLGMLHMYGLPNAVTTLI